MCVYKSIVGGNIHLKYGAILSLAPQYFQRKKDFLPPVFIATRGDFSWAILP